MAFEDKSTTQLVQEIRELFRVASETMNDTVFVQNLMQVGQMFKILDARLSRGDSLPDQWQHEHLS